MHMCAMLPKAPQTCTFFIAGRPLQHDQQFGQSGVISKIVLQVASIFPDDWISAEDMQRKHRLPALMWPKPSTEDLGKNTKIVKSAMYMRFIYTCSWPDDDSLMAVDENECKRHITVPAFTGKDVSALAVHNVMCEAGSHLAQFKVNHDADKLLASVAYTCCAMKKRPGLRVRKLQQVSQAQAMPVGRAAWGTGSVLAAHSRSILADSHRM